MEASEEGPHYSSVDLERSAVGFAIRDDDMVQQRWGN